MSDRDDLIGGARVAANDAADARGTLAEALRAVGAGDRRAFEEVYRRTAAKLFGVCLRILPERSQAEDALQDVYLSVWQRAGGFEEARGTAMTWLITLARNRAIDRLRATVKAPVSSVEPDERIADGTPDAFEMLSATGEERRLSECLTTLDGRDTGLIRAAFMEGASYPDLATRAGLPLGTVKSRIRRALLKLRDCLQ